jgi:hypothetical protein
LAIPYFHFHEHLFYNVSTFFYELSMTSHARALSSKNLLQTPADSAENGNKECSADLTRKADLMIINKPGDADF